MTSLTDIRKQREQELEYLRQFKQQKEKELTWMNREILRIELLILMKSKRIYVRDVDKLTHAELLDVYTDLLYFHEHKRVDDKSALAKNGFSFEDLPKDDENG